jgi:hypothetical protein
MRRFAFFIVVAVQAVLIVAGLATAQTTSGFIEVQSSWVGADISQAIDLSATGNIIGPIDWYFWSMNSKNWSQAYAGPTFSLFKWLQIGGAYGVETGHDRRGSFVLMSKGPFSLLGLFENGAGYWHRIVGNLGGAPVGVGFLHQTLLIGRRTGPRIEMSNGRLKVWAAYMGPSHIITGAQFLF